MLLETNGSNSPAKPSLLKRIRKIFLRLFLFVLFLLTALLTLLFIYEDEVKAALVKEINQHLKAEVKIAPENIDLTIIRSFPDCSIQFSNLLMLEALPLKNRDTLLFAGQLNLHFNIKDLWNKNYTIKKIKLRNAVAKPRILKNGDTNYEFWKKEKNKKKVTEDKLSFNLQLISIENTRFMYKDKKNYFKTSFTIQKLAFKGRFADDKFDLESDARLFIEEVVQGKTNYLKNKQLHYAVKLQVNETSYLVEKADVQLNELAISLNGKFNYSDSLELLELHYKAPDLDISSLLSLLPDKFKENMHDYESDGNFYAGGTIRYLNRNAYSIVSDFGIRKGQITYKPNSTHATKVNMEGYLNYSNQSSVLNLKNIHLNLEEDEIKGNCLINNFSDPYLQFTASASVNLENLLAFWPVDTIRSAKGNIHLNAGAEGLLRLLKEQTFSDKVKLNLDASVSGLEVQFKHDEKLYKVESCLVSAREREVEVKDLLLKRGSSDMKVNGKIPGLFNYIMDTKAPLTITGSLYSSYIKMEDFMTSAKGSSESNTRPLIPANVNFKLNAAILKFSFGKFDASAVTGEIEIKNQKALFSDIKFQSMQGEVVIDALADNSKGRLNVAIQSQLKKINITQLFAQLNNFGQENLTDKHLKGTASATIDFSGSWSNALEADMNSIQSTCDLLVQQGELNDFKPLLSLSRFVDVEELKRIKFSSLESSIEIKESKIILPRTAIKNSALNIEVWGTHAFDNRIDYHIQLIINQYLAKKRKKKESEFGPIENDPDNRRSAFILMKGTVDDPDIRFDIKGLKEKIRMDMKRENKNVKQVFREEWKLFKKDSSLKKQKPEEVKFELETPQATPAKKTLEPKKREEVEDF